MSARAEARKEARELERTVVTPETFDRFTDAANRVLTLAEEEAQRFNHNYVGSEHLLLGVIRCEEPAVKEILDGTPLDLNRTRSCVEFIIGRGHRLYEEAPLTPRAKRCILLAAKAADRHGCKDIRPEHMLYGIADEGEGIGSGVIESLNVRLEWLKSHIETTLGDRPDQSFGESVEKALAELPRGLQLTTRIKVMALLNGLGSTIEPLK